MSDGRRVIAVREGDCLHPADAVPHPQLCLLRQTVGECADRPARRGNRRDLVGEVRLARRSQHGSRCTPCARRGEQRRGRYGQDLLNERCTVEFLEVVGERCLFQLDQVRLQQESLGVAQGQSVLPQIPVLLLDVAVNLLGVWCQCEQPALARDEAVPEQLRQVECRGVGVERD